MSEVRRYRVWLEEAGGFVEVVRADESDRAVAHAADLSDRLTDCISKHGDIARNYGMVSRERDALSARLAEAERLLRYWTPDETMVKPEHSAEWDRTVKWLADSADLLCTTCGAKSSVYTRVRCNRPNCPTQTASGGES